VERRDDAHQGRRRGIRSHALAPPTRIA
jgi:hypothetical protein